MINKNIHMRDQVTNRIEIIMQEGRISYMHQLEELTIAVLLVAVFVVGVGFWVSLKHNNAATTVHTLAILDQMANKIVC